MYLTKDTIKSSLRKMADPAPGSKFVMTFMLPIDQVDREDQPGDLKKAGTGFERYIMTCYQEFRAGHSSPDSRILY
jgi:hypothetical protein